MSIKFPCPHCGSVIKCNNSSAGKRAKCPGCKQPITVPGVEVPCVASVPVVAVAPLPDPVSNPSPDLLPGLIADSADQLSAFNEQPIQPRGSKGLLLLAIGGAVAFTTLVVVCAGGIAFLKFRSDSGPVIAATGAIDQGQGGIEIKSATELAKHPWWRKPVTPGKINDMAAAVAQLQKDDEKEGGAGFLTIIVHSNGEFEKTYLPSSGTNFSGPEHDNPTTACLQGSENSVCIQFVPGIRRRAKLLSGRQAFDLLAKMVEAAHASEEKFRRTGVGDSLIDQLLNAEGPKDSAKSGVRP